MKGICCSEIPGVIPGRENMDLKITELCLTMFNDCDLASIAKIAI
jgi:hypothetical protein